MGLGPSALSLPSPKITTPLSSPSLKYTPSSSTPLSVDSIKTVETAAITEDNMLKREIVARQQEKLPVSQLVA